MKLKCRNDWQWIFHTPTTVKKPALTVLITSSTEVAPLITAIEARCTGEKCLREKGEKIFMKDTDT
jgi:hypothetical protein